MKILYFLALLLITAAGYSQSNTPVLVKHEEQFIIPFPEEIEIGYTYSASLNGEQFTSVLTAVDSDGQTWHDSKGCITKRLVQFSFPILWRNCEPFPDGTASIEYGGRIWPLKIGRKFYFIADFGNSKLKRECEVTSSYQILLNNYNYDTLKVVCTDSWNELVWYIDIKDGKTVIHEHVNSYYSTDDQYIIQ